MDFFSYLICFVSLFLTGHCLRISNEAEPETSTINVNDTYNFTTEEYLDESVYYTYYSSNYSKEFFFCPKITMQNGSYQMLENGSVFIPLYYNLNRTFMFETGNYLIYDNTLLICYHSVEDIMKNEEAMKNSIIFLTNLGLISKIFLSLSLCCLFLHFLAFMIVPEMRNLPGKTLASLTVSIFMSYLLFLISRGVYIDTPPCAIIGYILYYFFMASFFWMNAIAFDIFKSFREAMNKLRLPSRSVELRRFILYSIYSWVTPLIFVGIVIIGDKTSLFPEELQPGLDELKCWFENRLAAISFFAIPFAVLLIGNVCFFVASAFIIFSNSMKSHSNLGRLKIRFVLYLKLAVLMGLVWIIGLAAGFVDERPLWYIFVSLVTLQGLFIFVAFTRFRKTAHRLCERFNAFPSSTISSSQREETRFSRKTANTVILRESQKLKSNFAKCKMQLP